MELVAFVNGKRHILPPQAAEQTLLGFLRGLGFTGTKLGCGEGGCGACTVMVSSWSSSESISIHRAVNACLTPLYSVEGCAVTTVEGVGSLRTGLHPVQARIASSHGSQCGFCTPGFVMSMYSLLRNRHGADITEEEIEEALSGNLCRCTGYRPILEAYKHFVAHPIHNASSDWERDAVLAHTAETRAAAGALPAPVAAAIGGTGVICPSTGLPCSQGCNSATAAVFPSKETASSDGAGDKEFIFPPALRRWQPQPLAIEGPVASWYRPTDLPGLLRLLATFPHARLVAGNTEIGIESRIKGPAAFPILISPSHIPELVAIRFEAEEASLHIGAAATLTQLEHELGRLIAAAEEEGTETTSRGWAALRRQLRWFAGLQVRNVATVGGNVATGSPISDLNPLWVALGATFVLVRATAPSSSAEPSEITTRKVAAADMFIGYRKTALLPGEAILRVEVPATARDGLEFVHEFKQSHRREDDIAIVNAGMRVRFAVPEKPGEAPLCAEATLVFGGMAARTAVATLASAALVGRPWNREGLAAATRALQEDFVLDTSTPGGMPSYRSALAASFLFKFWVGTCIGLASALPQLPLSPPALMLLSDETSAAPVGLGGPPHPRTGRPPRGLQYWTRAADALHPVGTPLMHASAEAHATGEALYVDDIPPPRGLLHAVRLLSDRPHALLLGIDASLALRVPGVVGFFGAVDIPGSNAAGHVVQDEFLFVPVGEEVTWAGQLLGVVVAENEAAARTAVTLIRVEYGPDLPAIFSIDSAIAAGSFYNLPGFTGHALERGDAAAALVAAESDVSMLVFSGEARCGGQEHFYLEPHGTLMLPTESGGMDMISSTQSPSDNQHAVGELVKGRAE
jgi:xanthine dehydrogenase/oxidase